MLFLNFHFNKEKIIIIISIITLIVIILSYLGNGIIHCHDKLISKFRINNTDEERRNFMKSYLIEPLETPYKKEYVKIPNDFNKVYMEYEAIQNEMGLSLECYKGKTIAKYSYQINNRKDDSMLYANLFCYNGYVVACDVLNPSFKNGFIMSFKKYKENFSLVE